MSTLTDAYKSAGFAGSGGPLDVCARKGCTAPAAYQLRFDGCGPCGYQGEAECHGAHTLCAPCTARLRVKPPVWLGPLVEVRTYRLTEQVPA